MRIRVIGKSWKMKFMSARWFKKLYPKTRAITELTKRRVVFNIEDCVLEDIAHELVHCYMEELCAGEAVRLNVTQLEEHFAELISKHGETLIQQSKDVYAHYISIKESA